MSGAGAAAGSAGFEAAFRDLGQLWAWQGAQMTNSKSWDRWKNAQTRGFEYKQIGLKNAGLNPILAASSGLGLGGGAGGGGMSPVVAGGSSGTPRADIAASAQRMAAAKQARKQISVMDAQIDNLNANSAKATQEAGLAGARQWNEVLQAARNARYAEYYADPASKRTVANLLENQALPQTVGAAGVKGFQRLLQHFWDPIDSEARAIEDLKRNGLVPKGNRAPKRGAR